MDTYNTDDELDKFKSWWKSYGSSVVAGIVIGLALLGGITYWKHYTSERAIQASVLYDSLIAGASQNDIKAAMESGTQLMGDYAATPYAGKAALILAKLRYDAADIEAARKHLQWAVDHGTEAVTRRVARLRLARILIQQNALDRALKLANVSDAGGFVSEFQELRGDILLAQNNKAGARSAYAKALEALTKGSPYARILKMKLDDLGGDANTAASESAK